MNEEFKIKNIKDDVLSIEAILLYLSFQCGEKQISRRTLAFNERSKRYLYYVNTEGKSSGHVAIQEIGDLKVNYDFSCTTWSIICYMHKEKESMELMTSAMRKYKETLILLAASIPDIYVM